MFRIPLALAVICATAANAAIFDRDDRNTPINADFDAVGVLTGGEGVVYGSAFLVDACTILSARHVAGAVPSVIGRALIFQTRGSKSRGIVIAAGQYYDPRSRLRPIDADWMLVRLDHCIGRQFGFLSLADVHSSSTLGTTYGDAGFPRDHAIRSGPTVDENCQIHWVGGGRIAHDCATIAGNSGGPILARRGKKWIAIGINVAGDDSAQPRKFDAGAPNLAVDISWILPKICTFLNVGAVRTYCIPTKRPQVGD